MLRRAKSKFERCVMWYAIVIAVVLVLAVAPYLREKMRPEIGESARLGTDGDFVALSQGITHYRWGGPTRGPVAVLIHGLTTPSVGLEGIAEGLGMFGYRVLIYDLFGRGLSDAPAGLQDRDFFLQQLVDLLASQGIEDEITLVGYSMGASIAVSYAAAHPEKVERVIMLAGAGVKTNESKFSHFCRTTPILGPWAHGFFARRRILRDIPRTARSPEVQKVLMAQRQELGRRGYLPAVLSSRKGLLSETMKEAHQTLGREDIPVIALWGENDPVIPISAVGQLAEWNRYALQEVIDGADHTLPYTESKKVVAALREALRHGNT